MYDHINLYSELCTLNSVLYNLASIHKAAYPGKPKTLDKNRFTPFRPIPPKLPLTHSSEKAQNTRCPQRQLRLWGE